MTIRFRGRSIFVRRETDWDCGHSYWVWGFQRRRQPVTGDYSMTTLLAAARARHDEYSAALTNILCQQAALALLLPFESIGVLEIVPRKEPE